MFPKQLKKSATVVASVTNSTICSIGLTEVSLAGIDLASLVDEDPLFKIDLPRVRIEITRVTMSQKTSEGDEGTLGPTSTSRLPGKSILNSRKQIS